MMVDDDRARGRNDQDPQGEDPQPDSQHERERRRGAGETIAAAGAAGAGLGAGAAASFVGTSEALDRLVDGEQEAPAEEADLAGTGPDAETLAEVQARIEAADEAARKLALDVFESRAAAAELPEGVTDPGLIIGDSVPAPAGGGERPRPQPEDAVPPGGEIPGGPPPIGRPRGQDAPDEESSAEGPGAAPAAVAHDVPGAPQAPDAPEAPAAAGAPQPPLPDSPAPPSIPEPPAGPGAPPPPPAGPSGGGDDADVVTAEQPAPPSAEPPPAAPGAPAPSEGAAPEPPSGGTTEAPGAGPEPGEDAPIDGAPPSAPGSPAAPAAPPAEDETTEPPAAPPEPGASTGSDEPAPEESASPPPPGGPEPGAGDEPGAPTEPGGDQAAYPYVVDWSADGGWVEVLAMNEHGDVLRYRYDTDGTVYYIDGEGNYHELHDERLPQLLYVDDHGVGYFALPHVGDGIYFSLDTHGRREWLEEHEIPGYESPEEEQGDDYPRVVQWDADEGWVIIDDGFNHYTQYYLDGRLRFLDEQGNEVLPNGQARYGELLYVDEYGRAYFKDDDGDGNAIYVLIDHDGGIEYVDDEDVPDYGAGEEVSDYPRIHSYDADAGWAIIEIEPGEYVQYFSYRPPQRVDENGDALEGPYAPPATAMLAAVDEQGNVYLHGAYGQHVVVYAAGGEDDIDPREIPGYEYQPPDEDAGDNWPHVVAWDADAGWVTLGFAAGYEVRFYEGGGAYYLDDQGNEHPAGEYQDATLMQIDSQGNAYFRQGQPNSYIYFRLDEHGIQESVDLEDIPGYEHGAPDDEAPVNGEATDVRYFLPGYGDGYAHPEDIYEEPDEIREEGARTVHIYNGGLNHVDYRPDGRTYLLWYDADTGVLDMQILITPSGEVQIQVYPHEYALDYFDRIVDTSGLGEYAYPDPDTTGMSYEEVFIDSRIVRTYEDGTVKTIYNYDSGRIDISYPDGTYITATFASGPELAREGDGGYAPPGAEGPEEQDAPEGEPEIEDGEIIEGPAYDLNYVYNLIPDTQPAEFEGGLPNPEHDASYQYHDTVTVGTQPVHLLSNGAGRTIAVQENSDGTVTLHWYDRSPGEIGPLSPDGLEAYAVLYPNGSYRLGYPESSQPDDDPPLEETEIVEAEENYLPDWLPLSFEGWPSPAQEGFAYLYTAEVEGAQSHVYSNGQYVIALSDYGNGAGRVLIDDQSNGEGWDAGYELFGYGDYELMEEYADQAGAQILFAETPSDDGETPEGEGVDEDLQFTDEDETSEPLSFDQPESAEGDDGGPAAEAEGGGAAESANEAGTTTEFATESEAALASSEEDESLAGDSGAEEELDIDDLDEDAEL